MKRTDLIFIIFIFLIFTNINARETITLATYEQEPYIGKNLENQGYVFELVTKIFERADYDVKVTYYPLARGKFNTENGYSDCFFPAFHEEAREDKLAYSKPFIGNNIGLLKNKSLEIPEIEDLDEDNLDFLEKLEKYSFGSIRGRISHPEIMNKMNISYVTTDIQNVLKLGQQRLDFVLIDKYAAASILVNEAPHLIGKFEFFGPTLLSKDFHVAFSKRTDNYKEKRSRFNKAFSEMIEDGTYREILLKHGYYIPQFEDSTRKTLTIGTVNNKEMLIMEELAVEYEKLYPKIDLQFVVMEENTLRKRLMEDIATSGGRYDIVTIGSFETPIWARNGWLIPLTDFPDDYMLEDVLENVRESLSYSNKLFALPFYSESIMTYYRKDLFDKANIKMPENPTFEDILAFAERLHDPVNEIYGIGIRGKVGWGANMSFITSLVHAFGGQWFDKSWDTTILSPEWRNALSLYINLVKYAPEDILNYNFNELKQLFLEGKLAIWIDATVAAGSIFDSKSSSVYNRTAYTNAPIEKERKMQWLWSWALGIPVSTDSFEEAIEFITWATSKEYIKMVGERYGWESVPPGTRHSTYQNQQYNSVAPFGEFVLKAITETNSNNNTKNTSPYTGFQYISIQEFPSFGYKVGFEIKKVLEGKITIMEALKNADKIVSDQMKKSGYAK